MVSDTSIVLFRPWDATGLFRRLRVEIDGRRVARLRVKQSHKHPVAPGTHVVRARLDWMYRPALPVDVPAGTRKAVLVTPATRRFWLAFVRPSQVLYIELLAEDQGSPDSA